MLWETHTLLRSQRERKRLRSKYDSNYFGRSRGTDLENYRLRKVYEMANPVKEELILDSGCGTGEFLLKCSSVCDSVGIDFAGVALKTVKKKTSCFHNSNAHLVLGDVCYLPFRNSIFDKAISADVVEHLHARQFSLYLAELYRVLKLNGQLILHTMPNKWSVNYILTRFARVLKLFDIESDEYERHVNLQTPYSLGKYLHATRFKTKIWSTTGVFRGFKLPNQFSLINCILSPLSKCGWLTHYMCRDLWAIAKKN